MERNKGAVVAGVVRSDTKNDQSDAEKVDKATVATANWCHRRRLESTASFSQSPHFNMPAHCFDVDMLQEFLFCMAESNRQLVTNHSPNSGYFKRQYVVGFVFDMCDRLALNAEGKFLAVELFDRFMCAHLAEIDAAVCKSSPLKDWTPVLTKIKKQMLLRALTCVQIAGKLTSNSLHQIISCTQLRQLLGELGCAYSVESIMSSELRVLKKLEFQINVTTPHQYLETLLEVLGANNQAASAAASGEVDQTKVLYLIGVTLLEAAYCLRDQIYNRLHETITGRTKHPYSDREPFLAIENNYLYLAASIVVAAAHIYDHRDRNLYNRILDSMSFITKLDRDDIDDLALIICHFCLLDNNNNDVTKLG